MEWKEIVLEKRHGIEPYEVTQVLTGDRRWPGLRSVSAGHGC